MPLRYALDFRGPSVLWRLRECFWWAVTFLGTMWE